MVGDFPLKAVSMYPEWAMMVALGMKTVECRTWSTSHRGDLLVCSSSRRSDGFVSGHALCVVDLLSVEAFGHRHMVAAGFGPHDDVPDSAMAWLLGDVRLVRPFPVKGRLHLFDVPDDSIEVVGPPSRMLVEELFFPVMHRSKRNSQAELMWLETFDGLGWRLGAF